MGHRHGVRRTRTRLLARGSVRSLYLFDPEDRRWRRPWKKMLPAGFTEVEISGDRFRTVESAGEDAGDGVVIIHASQLPARKQQEALFDNSASAHLHLLLISGGRQEVSALAGHIHWRRTPVRMGEVDAIFRRCFARFWQHLHETGQMRFELLEPERGMLTVLALLCQGYLLAHVAPGTATVTLPGADDAGNLQATEAMARLGVRARRTEATAAFPRDRQAQVRDPSWWSPLDLGNLKNSLSSANPEDPAMGLLVDALAANQDIDGSGVLRAYLALETLLQKT